MFIQSTGANVPRLERTLAFTTAKTPEMTKIQSHLYVLYLGSSCFQWWIIHQAEQA